MSRVAKRAPRTSRGGAESKYDAHHTVLERTYGDMADLRRELADSKSAVAARTEILNQFSTCQDSQRAWLLLEDYFERLSLSRKDFPTEDWWPRLLAATGKLRLEELVLLFVKSNRSVPTELLPFANFERFAEIEAAEQEEKFVKLLEEWVLPHQPVHLDAPRASIRLGCSILALKDSPHLHEMEVEFHLSRPRSGEKQRPISEILELADSSAHEQEMFAPEDWQFVLWLHEFCRGRGSGDSIKLRGADLFRWVSRWGDEGRLAREGGQAPLAFSGEMVELTPHLVQEDGELCLTYQFKTAEEEVFTLDQARFFDGQPALVLVNSMFYVVRNPPSSSILEHWSRQARLPVKRLSHRLLTHLRKADAHNGNEWDRLCVTKTALPEFIFELSDDTIRLRLMAKSDQDNSTWQWNGHEWQPSARAARAASKPEILDDPRLEPATAWLSRLDWFTPEPGLWVGDANETFMGALLEIWPDRPDQAEYLGNPAFHRLFLNPKPLRPKLMMQGSGIDWLSVSAEWEIEGMKLTAADIERLSSATGKFVKLPDGGWMQLDTAAVREAHETLAELGIDGITDEAQKVSFLHASQLSPDTLDRLATGAKGRDLKERVKAHKGVAPTDLPASLKAELRPYQKEGFDFLCHLAKSKMGGVLADDMGLGKTLQTLAWLAWLRERGKRKPRPALVICPASVLHNWQREALRFVPDMKVLILESGSARHNLRRQIPEHDLIVTNYALLRRDLEALQKFEFGAIVLDEAQYIKNPAAQVTLSVKQLQADLKLALTGTPLENRLLDLWSIVDFIQPGYLGDQEHFTETYEPKGNDQEWAQKVARKRLSARLRPVMLRRLKRQVAQDLPERIEQRRDCELGEEQRKLYLAELRRSRDKVMQTIAEKGVAKSKIHVLAALTRLRQICCHPQLVGNDSLSGKTETLFELLEPLLAEGQKVLLFSQFVQMLQLIEAECKTREIPTHILTGETKQRQEVVNAFQADPNASVFLLSLRAAGTGLNLTTASYVVLYDPWWNPAVEAQAIDRSHRIGQTRTVNAYRLIAPGTVEEKIWELQQRKAQTISDVLGEEGFARSLTETDLEYLFSED